MSESLRHPQETPADHCYTILQDHGNASGWGPAAIMLPSLGFNPGPIAYTGSDEHTVEKLGELARALAQQTGKPTRLVRYQERKDVLVIGASS